jgi:hypothetical protein
MINHITDAQTRQSLQTARRAWAEAEEGPDASTLALAQPHSKGLRCRTCTDRYLPVWQSCRSLMRPLRIGRCLQLAM